jgi:hypothetical protein
MAKEKSKTNEKEVCTSIFKNETLTKEGYTHIWIELISTLERNKSVNFSPKS